MTNKQFTLLKYVVFGIAFIALFLPNPSHSQNNTDPSGPLSSLDDCIGYALTHQPELNQTQIEEEINKSNIRIATSGWWPQLSASANLQHYLKQPVVIFPDFTDPNGPKRKITTGVLNSSGVQFSATQHLYNTDLLFAGKTAPDYRSLASENTRRSKIDVVVDVSKAFYDVLLSRQQIKVLAEDIQRLEKNTKDAFNLFQNGVADKTDFQRAQIALNNARVAERHAAEAIIFKYAYLKQVMGFPSDSSISIAFDSTSVADLAAVDTLQSPDYNKRIEYQILQTHLRLQHDEVDYYKWSFLPSLSAFYNYNLVYQNDIFSELYNQNFPNSLIGLSLNLPLFQGTKRIQNLNIARLQYKQSELAVQDLKSRINTEYTLAMATYKSNLLQLSTDEENVKNAREIYNIISLQYNHGIKTYLDVIVAETDLRTAELNYLDTLFQVLSSSLDLKKALGIITIQ